jgi:hypothetical protein
MPRKKADDTEAPRTASKTPRMTLYVPIPLQQDMHRIAAKSNVSVSEWVRLVVVDYLDKHYSPKEVFDPEKVEVEAAEPMIMQDVIIQRMDRFFSDYQILRDRLELMKAAQDEMLKKSQEMVQANTDLISKLPPEAMNALLEMAHTLLATTQETAQKHLDKRNKTKK